LAHFPFPSFEFVWDFEFPASDFPQVWPLLYLLCLHKEMSMTSMSSADGEAFRSQENVNQGTGSDMEEAVRQLNSFLRGEISAAETYRMAIDKVADSEAASATANLGLLREIQEEHGRAAQALRDRIRELGGEPSDSSGAWGAWAKFTQGTANLFGDASSLKSLKEGEEHGLKDYQEGVDDIDMISAELVNNQLIPAQQRHINLLDQLISSVGSTTA
jgi:bacterioferritin (cytochrome b1)